jgi:hypothetical protein
MHLLISLIVWMLIGTISAYYAKQRGRNSTTWFFIGLFLGLIGLILLFILPKYPVENDTVLEEQANVQLADSPPLIIECPQDDWFYLDDKHEQQGPITFYMLRSKWRQGKICNDSFVWREGMVMWQKLHDLPDVLDKMQAES